jgi:putative membrane protein
MKQTKRSLFMLALGLTACQGRGSPSLATTDNNFIMQAAAGGVGEVALGQLAERRSSNPAVQQFAQHMITEHTPANRELIAIAGRKGVIPPTTLDPGRANASRQLSALTGTTFDQQYMAQQVQDHELQLALYRQQAQSGVDPELRAFAAKYRPMVEGHAQMARSVLNSVAVPVR